MTIGDLLKLLIEQLNSAVAILILLVLIGFWAVYKAGGMITLFTSFKEENKDTKKDIKDIKDDLSKVKATTELLYQSHLQTVKSTSPLNLTPLGAQIATDLSIENKVANHWDAIKDKLGISESSNPYDIQTSSINIARECFESLFSSEEKSEIKTYAYQKGLNLLEIHPVIGIIIRNKTMNELGIKIDEIDKHAPQK